MNVREKRKDPRKSGKTREKRKDPRKSGKTREKRKEPRKAERPEKSGKTREKRKDPRKASYLVFQDDSYSDISSQADTANVTPSE